MSESGQKVVKAIVGAVVLMVLVITVARWYGDFRISTTNNVLEAVEETATPPQGEGGETEATIGDAQQPEPQGSDSEPTTSAKTVVVLTDGLNFRQEPKKDSKVIRGLDKGEKLVLIEEKGGWYRVKTSDGVEGWITASSSYSRVE